jgi:Tol biopolymer transport system component
MKARYVAMAGFALAGVGWSQVTQRVSVSSNGRQANGGHTVTPSISADGRFIAFDSDASDLVPGDTNGTKDVFVRDRSTGATERVSVSSSGQQGNGYSQWASISADGRYVAFESGASNLAAGATGVNIFVRDRTTGTTELVSANSAGQQGNLPSTATSISGDGRYVAFMSGATNLVANDTNGFVDIFVRDRQTATTERVSLSTAGAQGDSDGYWPAISPDGRYVAFSSAATNLVPGDNNNAADAFLRDRLNGTTECVNLSSTGVFGNDESFSPMISSNGRYVAFQSYASNLVAGDNNFSVDIFVRDRQSGTTELVSVDSAGVQGNGDSQWPSISADGRYVAFQSAATNLVPGDTNGMQDLFLRDRQSGTTERVSVSSGGEQGNSDSWAPPMTPDGRFLAFQSNATNLVAGDTNGALDVFVRDRFAGPAFTSLCEPGSGGVIACPCANPPSGPGRGCDNSAATGGAILSASGDAYLSSDSLAFTTSAEGPTATSIVLQGSSVAGSGVVYGQGVRCVGGFLARLYTKSASGGSITAPDFNIGDVTVSERSISRGDPIVVGQSRWYLVYYRDPNVLGGCPAASTFNATQTAQVVWLP